MESGIISVPDESFRDPDFDPSDCAGALEFIAFALRDAAMLGAAISPDILAEMLETSAGILRYAHAWAVELAKRDNRSEESSPAPSSRGSKDTGGSS